MAKHRRIRIDYKSRRNRIRNTSHGRYFFLSFFVEFCRRESSTQFDNLQQRLTKLLLQNLSNSAVEEFDISFRQHFQTVFDNIRQNFLSNAGEKCRMPSIAGEKYCLKMMSSFDNIFRQ